MKFCQRRCNNLPGGSLPLGKEHRNYNPLQAIKAFLQTSVTLVKSLIWLDLVWFGLIWLDLVWFGLIWLNLAWFGLIWLDLWIGQRRRTWLSWNRSSLQITRRQRDCKHIFQRPFMLRWHCTIHYGNLEIFIWSILWIVIIPICVPAVEVRKSFL